VEPAVAVAPLLLVAVAGDVGCRHRRAQKSRRRRVRVGRESEQVAAAKLKRRKKVDVVEAELPPPVVDAFRS
jgi:hypothetical protein